ncbi:MAG TPA: SDR family NAD(P)-dependent oxidoreductase [Yinghuangia sp.]|nr:SDR family NAD(P)-dependent oxidoreductase [Yinghuangia sp.]
MLLQGRTAVVTGAARGIGAATAAALARFGADVAVCDREDMGATVKTVEEAGRRVYAATVDVREGDAVRTFLTASYAEFGAFDVP